jgi:hypothetical protein
MLLALASVVFHGSESLGAREHIFPVWGTRYRASGRTQQKTPPPTIFYFYGRLPSDISDNIDVFTDRCLVTGRYAIISFWFWNCSYNNTGENVRDKLIT